MALARTVQRLPTVERDGESFGRLIVKHGDGQTVRVLVQGEQLFVDQFCSELADRPQVPPPPPPSAPPTEQELLARVVRAAAFDDLNARYIIRTILQESALGDPEAHRLFMILVQIVPTAAALRELAR